MQILLVEKVLRNRSVMFARCLTIMLLVVGMMSPILNIAKTAEKSSRSKEANIAVNMNPNLQWDVDTDKPHVLAASYYSLRDDLKASLTLNNKGTRQLEVQPTLFSLQGDRLNVPIITVEANSHRVIDLEELLTNTTLDFREGSLQLFYRGKDLVLGAQIKLVDVEHSLIFDEQLVEPNAMFSSARLEGVWWLPSLKSQISLIASNTTEAPLPVKLSIEGLSQKQKEFATLTLSPRETRVLDVRSDILNKSESDLSEVGGVTIEHSGVQGALLARGLIEDSALGYSGTIPFADPQNFKSSNLHGAGLRLGKVKNETLMPIVVARNIGNTLTRLSGRITFTENDGKVSEAPITQVTLKPGKTRVINLKKTLGKLRLEQIASAGLEFEHTGEPGSVMVSARSVSKSGNQVFQVPIIDSQSLPSSTGGYPWIAEGNLSTLTYIKNTTDKTRPFVCELSFNGAGYSLGMKLVEAGQTMAIDFRELRDREVPDARGRIIPKDLTHAQIHWSSHGEGSLALIGRAEQVDIVTGISSSYACVNCCADQFVSGYSDPGGVTGVVGDVAQFTAYETEVTCYGNYVGPYSVSYGVSWSSSNTAVATVDHNGIADAVGVGNANINATWNVHYTCPGAAPFTCSSTCDVTARDCTISSSGYQLITEFSCAGEKTVTITFTIMDNPATSPPLSLRTLVAAHKLLQELSS